MRAPAKLGSVISAALCLTAVAPMQAAGVGEVPQVIRFDGGRYDSAGAMTVDGSGNLYVGGAIDPPSGAISFGVAKLTPQGNVLWARHYSGSRGGVGGQVHALAVDTAGNVYAAGLIGDGVMFNTNYDWLVAKFGADGSERWAFRFDGPARGYDVATELVIGSSGVYVSGFSYARNVGQDFDWMTMKFAADGALQWQRQHSGPGAADDRVADMVLSPSGNVVLTGFTKNTGDEMTNDLETLMYDPAGSVVWRRTWTAAPTTHEVPFDMDVDAAGRIAVTGTTAENPSPYVAPSPVTLRYNSAGALIQTVRGPGAGGEAVDVDAAGNVYLAGAFFATPTASMVAKYDATGAQIWATPLTVGDNDVLGSLRLGVHASGAVTLAGTVSDVSTGNSDYLTIRYNAAGGELWRHRFGGVPDPGNRDEVVALAIDATDAVLVTGTSWNGYVSSGGTANDIVTLRFPAGAAPALLAPSNLAATGVSASEIRLTWRDNAGTEDGFRLERCRGVGCTAFAQIAEVGHDVTAYIDGGLARNTQYTYRVRAFNAGGVSAYSNTATGKTRKR